MSMFQRETAKRIFAIEFNDSNFVLKGEGDKDPNYLITPLGAKLNRVYVVGVATEKENIGTEEEPLWRIRVSDPTGTYFVIAGKYQPNAMSKLGNADTPCFCAIVGKVSTFKSDEGDILTSLNAEMFKTITENDRNRWVIETARSLKRRIGLAKKVKNSEEMPLEELVELGFDEEKAESFRKAIKHYGVADIDRYIRSLEISLKYVLPEYENKGIQHTPGEVDEEDSEMESVKSAITTVLNGVGEGSEGMEYDKVYKSVQEDFEDLNIEKFEEAVGELRTSGSIYEPVLGNLKLIE